VSGPSRRPSGFRRGVLHRSRRLPPIPGGVPGCLPASARLPAADEAPRVIKRPWYRDTVVLVSIPDEAAFHEQAESTDYQRISADRRASADTLVLPVQAV